MLNDKDLFICLLFSFFHQMFTKGPCENGGQYFKISNEAECICSQYFFGKFCERFKLSETEPTLSSGKVKLEWKSAIKLTRTYILLYKIDSQPPRMNILRSTDKCIQKNIGVVRQQVLLCILEVRWASKYLNITERSIPVDECIRIPVETNWNTLAGYCLAAGLILIVAGIVRSQRRKWTLIYSPERDRPMLVQKISDKQSTEREQLTSTV
ncbi:unnamed protein product [Dimorphilus gyrociliatus]|uniref:EGF-like domain-containing protein n=1 Tax=Dimorphilus gyrociliatus TaxID=2664684 RepID=A0A7I8W602_9ANNE|nr:unnamed protein product [Dimorphilus gyrociliatus]